jgi:predicted site-specific integrase-resolvase
VACEYDQYDRLRPVGCKSQGKPYIGLRYSTVFSERQQTTLSRLVGYARVSTQDQDLALQIDALIRCGVAKELIFTDKAPGAKHQRPGLDTCLNELHDGDILLVWRLDRLGRSMRHLVT